MRERQWEKYGRNSREGANVSEEGEAGGALQPMVKIMVRQMCPCSLWGTLCQGRWMHLVWGWDLMESPLWSRLLAGTAVCRERHPHWSRFLGKTSDSPGAPCWSRCSWRTVPCGRDLEQFLKNCRLWEGPCWSSSVRTVSHGKDPMLEQGTSMRKKESQRWRALNWPQCPHPLHLHCSKCGGRQFLSEAEPEKKEEAGGESVIRFFIFTVLPCY